MKLFLKILLFVFVALIANVNAASASITFPNIQETTTSLSFQNEKLRTIYKGIINDKASCDQNEQKLVDYRNWGVEIEIVAAKSSTTGFRYMSQAELKAIQETGYLRGGWPGEICFTKDLYKSAAKAQSRLSLGSSSTLRVEFEILNNPTLLRNGTKVSPLNGMVGVGSELMTLDTVKDRLIN